jgi:putative spermidine/putrescine transport system substrate-binding protein
MADTADGTKVIGQSWDSVLAEARGGTVNFFLWGGADNINQYVSDYIGGILKSQYDITLNRVGLNDTVDAVNIVLGEKEAGKNDSGSVDMIWINGENFRTMKQADLVFCGYLDTLPNNKLVNWKDPSVANDFGIPVDQCEVPWSRTQFAYAYDSATVPQPPTDMAGLLAWIKANPGQFTYPAPPDFNGSAFVRQVFYYAAGGPDQLLGDFNQAKFDEVAPKAWKILNDLKPYLWRQGETYPADINALNQLFANHEVSFTFNYEPAQFGVAVDNGTYPNTTRSFGLTDGTLGNTNYVLIPYNSPHKAAAMVLANVLLSYEAQLQKAKPEVWGTSPAIDISALPADQKAAFDALPRHESVVAASELAKHALPELQGAWVSPIEAGWKDNVAK